MKYQFLKLQFQTAVHFGDGGLTTCENIIPADTLFSALCCEAAKIGAFDFESPCLAPFRRMFESLTD